MKTREEAIRRANELFPGKSSRNYNRYNGFLACYDWLNEPEPTGQFPSLYVQGKDVGYKRCEKEWREKIQNLQGWVSIAETNRYPKEDQTVWMYNAKDKSIWLGCYVYLKNAGWLWAISNGSIFTQEGKIMGEADIDDFYEITHWCAVPGLPLG